MRGGDTIRVNLICPPEYQQSRPSRPHHAAVANLVIRCAALPPCTCGYLERAASGALGRTTRQCSMSSSTSKWLTLPCTSSANPVTYNISRYWFYGVKNFVLHQCSLPIILHSFSVHLPASHALATPLPDCSHLPAPRPDQLHPPRIPSRSVALAAHAGHVLVARLPGRPCPRHGSPLHPMLTTSQARRSPNSSLGMRDQTPATSSPSRTV